jgi:transcriptional regulator with XRE-family HTH domain
VDTPERKGNNVGFFALIEKDGRSARELAPLLGVSHSYLSKVLRHSQRPNNDLYLAAAQLWQIDLGQLISETEMQLAANPEQKARWQQMCRAFVYALVAGGALLGTTPAGNVFERCTMYIQSCMKGLGKSRAENLSLDLHSRYGSLGFPQDYRALQKPL